MWCDSSALVGSAIQGVANESVGGVALLLGKGIVALGFSCMGKGSVAGDLGSVCAPP